LTLWGFHVPLCAEQNDQRMIKQSVKITERGSISLFGIMQRRSLNQRPLFAARAAGFMGRDTKVIHETDTVAVIVEAEDASSVARAMEKVPKHHAEQVVQLSQKLLSLQAGEAALKSLFANKSVQRVQTTKKKTLHMDVAAVDIGLRTKPQGARRVAEEGTGVLIGIIDSGFDLSHPMFRDGSGKLRVERLLWQRGSQPPREFSMEQLTKGWANGSNPGADQNGHGTHVASIAGGTAHQGIEGIAPGARFVLVKTDFLNTDKAVKWIYDKAGPLPCVVNMSLGHHWGAHDGTDAEERYHASLAQTPGKIICISAGNEHEDRLHIGGRFTVGEEKIVEFMVFRAEEPGNSPSAAMTLWHDEKDRFSVTLVTPDGTEFAAPALGQLDQYQAPKVSIQFGRDGYAWSKLVQIQIQLGFSLDAHPVRDLDGWKLKFRFASGTIGRLDGWFANSGMGAFKPSGLLEEARTVGLSATGAGCIAVASHVSKTKWDSDQGPQKTSSIVGRISRFSSLGPTRDGRPKPEISAPGEMITAALATGSEMAQAPNYELYRNTAKRLLTIQGTSMACPVITGVIALMLQKKNTLTTGQVRDILHATARKDVHTGVGDWNPAYGYGKVDVAAALAAL